SAQRTQSNSFLKRTLRALRAPRFTGAAPMAGRFNPGRSAVVADSGEVADGGGDEALLVLVVRAVARGVEGARGAVEIAPQQEHRGDAERGAIGRWVDLERAREEASC